MRESIAKVKSVAAGSPADKAGLLPGDVIEGVDGYGMIDIIDWRYMTSDYSFTLQVLRNSQELELEVERSEMQGVGVEFEDILFDGIRECANKCVFCFVDQLPEGVRESLCIKDDDYRMSFLQGSFVTLTNCSQRTLDRIADYRMSPLYVSVHATDPSVRNRMLGRKSGRPILEVIRFLGSKDIEVHTQIVVVPGMNDAGILERSIADLVALHPKVVSVGIVPVGLTKHRKTDNIRPVNKEDAEQTISLVERFQSSCLERLGTRMVWAADEYYLRAERAFPPGQDYEGYVQIENGIGLVRSLYEDVESSLASSDWALCRETSGDVIITGTDGYKSLKPLFDSLMARYGTGPTLFPVNNRYFGSSVTVSGLIVGDDIVGAVREYVRDTKITGRLIIPDIMLRKGEALFLDDTSPGSVGSSLGMEVLVVKTDASGLLQAAGLKQRGEKQ